MIITLFLTCSPHVSISTFIIFMHIKVLIWLFSEPWLLNMIYSCILLIVRIIRAQMDVCLWACVCLCIRICTGCACVCVCMHVNVRHLRACACTHWGCDASCVYLQNLPEGHGKHSLSSCSPPWFECVYVPLGQGWGTIVPGKKRCSRAEADSVIYYIVITTKEYSLH